MQARQVSSLKSNRHCRTDAAQSGDFCHDRAFLSYTCRTTSRPGGTGLSRESGRQLANDRTALPALFETARDGILLLDSDQGKITDANPYMTELLGYSHDELLSKELWEIGLLQDKAAGQDAFQQLKLDGYIRYDNLPLENRWGEQREVEFVSTLYRENGHTVIQCNIRDITDRKRIEAELAAASIAAKNERIAETLQRSMLQTFSANQFKGVAVETLYQAALYEADVGGDFFDAFALSEEKVAFVMGDVSGKGLVAAARTVEVKYALRAFLHEYQAPELALSHLTTSCTRRTVWTQTARKRSSCWRWP